MAERIDKNNNNNNNNTMMMMVDCVYGGQNKWQQVEECAQRKVV